MVGVWLEEELVWSAGQVYLMGIPVGHKQGQGAVERHLEAPKNLSTLGLLSGAGLSNEAGENLLGQVPWGDEIAGLAPIPSSPTQIQSSFS